MTSIRSIHVTAELAAYMEEASTREDDTWQRLRAETSALPAGGMQIGADQARLLSWLVRLIGARRTLEIGTFTGASALAVAQALPDDGRVIACDMSEEWTTIARRYWADAGVADKIDLRLGPALDTLGKLRREGGGNFDFAFIDADKEPIWSYFEAALDLLRPGGLIAVDNTLWGGQVADPEANDADTKAIDAFNRRVTDDPRVDSVQLTVGDGLTLLLKR
ncbi:MAG: methyltransferase domain-containing protein [Chloroflexi bacterium]|nr:methyltransferase domain-containing protein [Chloroflexota bacterium]MXX81692.1 methyltransferase domain-containing protein [Chloroflexota bacterium]MYD17506.1 methyltransferase domain-containing protein [Chloroflexota bacterium]MYF21720.1 methyltransferase domain-containing protein [Chloroflexota bacterium]MYJ01355.1 methyltransferase domain-containing protein [Chloroflexota bacterium]